MHCGTGIGTNGYPIDTPIPLASQTPIGTPLKPPFLDPLLDPLLGPPWDPPGGPPGGGISRGARGGNFRPPGRPPAPPARGPKMPKMAQNQLFAKRRVVGSKPQKRPFFGVFGKNRKNASSNRITQNGDFWGTPQKPLFRPIWQKPQK